MTSRKRTVPIEKRLTHAEAKTAGALSLFHRAAAELDDAAAAHESIANEAYSNARRQDELAGAAHEGYVQSKQAAAKLRELIGG